MRAVSYIIPLLAVACLAPGCSDDPDALTGAYSGDGESAPEEDAPEGPTEPPPPVVATFAETTLARARAWIDAKMPYCGGPNGGADVICGGTCDRDGPAARPEWDRYRSDCSGFVSWSWGLPAPGRTTRTLAPTDTSVSSVIPVAMLAPGDALNGAGHVMLFGGWADERAGKALILQESKCGTVAHEKIATFTKVNDTTLRIADGRSFRSIRYKNAK